MVDDQTRCGNCSRILNEEHGLPSAHRLPCPKCGSIQRKYIKKVTAEVKVDVRDLRVEGIRAGMSKAKGWFKRFRRQRKAQSARGGRIGEVERIFERSGDYSERVTMVDTGEVIHECKEPLAQHKGHGSDKRRRK